MKLTLGKKLGLGFGAILALMVVSALLTYTKASAVKEMQRTEMQVRVPTIKALISLQRDLNQTQSKGRQVILAGNQSAQSAASKRAFDSAWDEVGKDLAALEALAPGWSLQENRDRLAETKTKTAALRETQEGIMKHAASGDRDTVLKAGSDFAEQATAVTEAIKKPLGEMAEWYTGTINKDTLVMNSETQSMNITLGVTTFVALTSAFSWPVS